MGSQHAQEITASLKRNYDDRATLVVSVMSPVVVSVGRRDREHREQSGEYQNYDLFHFCSSNFSLMDLGWDFELSGLPRNDLKLCLRRGLFTIAHFGRRAEFSPLAHHNCGFCAAANLPTASRARRRALYQSSPNR